MIRSVAASRSCYSKKIALYLVFCFLVGVVLSPITRAEESQIGFYINGYAYPVALLPGQTEGEWLVSLRDFAEQTGLTLGWLDESKTVRIKDTSVIAYLQVGATVALVNSNQFFLREPMQLVNDRLMIPLSFLAEVFGYETEIRPDRIDLSIPTELLTGLSATIQQGRPVVSIRTTGLPRFETYLLAAPDRIVVDLYDTQIDLHGDFDGSLPVETGILGIRWHQFRPNVARVVIDLARSVGFEVLPAPNGQGLDIQLYKQVQAVSFQRIFGKAQLEIKGSGPLHYSVTSLQNPERLVIDIEKATLATAIQELELPNDPLVNKIRVNQFLPHIVRIVLELNNPAGTVLAETADPNSLLFELVKKITGVQVSPVDGRLAFLIQGSGIDQYVVEYFPDLAQILVDIPSAILATDQPRLVFEQGPVSDVKLLQVAPTAVQVQIGLRGYRGHEVLASSQGLRVLVNESPLAGHRILIDPGHGGQDPGAIGWTGLREKDVVLDIALRLRDLLEKQGAEVILSREDDTFISLIDRACLAERTGAEVFVSIHVNSSVNKEANGTETYYYYADPKGQELATLIQREMLTTLELSNRAPRPNRDFVVLKENTVPAVLTEVAFISNRAEEKLLGQPAFRQKAAEAIFRGLVAYFAGPTWQYRELLAPTSAGPGLQEFLAPPATSGSASQSGSEHKEEFSWQQLQVTPVKPGAGIVDKVQVIQIQ